MADKTGPLPPAQSSAAEHRRKRLAETLRLNLQRRKGQARARRAGAADETDGLPAATGPANAARPDAPVEQHSAGHGPAGPYDDGDVGNPQAPDAANAPGMRPAGADEPRGRIK